MKTIKCTSGFTILELLIAMLITGIVAASGFQFYVTMHNQTLAQEDVSDMQQTLRASLMEISKTVRMAGYKIGSHIPYLINGDSLYVFFNGTQPVDSVLYYLADYGEGELGVAYEQEGMTPRKLMKKINSSHPVVFSEYINDITFVPVNSSTLEVILIVQTSRADEDFAQNGGFRTCTNTETITMRNI